MRDGMLHRELSFADFAEAFGFMARIAIQAEKLNHHPEWSNVWNKVTVDLITHDIGTLSDLDLDLATRIDRAASAE
jgi:4a-hydroxytetrahydrobiopterin dehydratase